MSRFAIPDDKKIEIIRCLQDRAWASFDERRRHEYRISLTFWAIYIVAIGYILKEGLPSNLKMKWLLAGGMILFSGMYLYWNFNLAKTQQLDRTIAIYFEEELLEACGIKQMFYGKFKTGKKSRVMGSTKPNLGFKEYLKNWNHRSELLVTLLLTILSICAIIFGK